MAEARSRQHWNHTASLLALLASIHRDTDQRSEPFAPAEFHPFEPHPASNRITKSKPEECMPIGFLIATFVD